MASRGRGGFRDRGDLNRRGIQKNLEGPAATFMPDHIRNLFRPRDELIWTAPVKPPSMGDSGSALSGTAEFTRWLKKDPPPIKRQETPLERRRRRAAERESAHSAVVEDSAKAWDPASDAKAKGSDPYRTLFVGRLAYETNERKLEREFGEFGRVTGVRVVRDPDSGNSRGYGFVEFETEDALKEAYRRADGRKVDGRRILVDVERGRTAPGFKPRRLGGGLGDTRGARLPKRRKRDEWLKPPVPKTDGFITAETKRVFAAAQQAAIDAASAAVANRSGPGAVGAVPGSVGVAGRTGYSILFDAEMLKLARKAYDDAAAAAAVAKAAAEAEAAAKGAAEKAGSAMAADAPANASAGAEAEAGEGAVPGEDGVVPAASAAAGSSVGAMAEDGSAAASSSGAASASGAAAVDADAIAPAPHGAPAHVDGDASAAVGAADAATGSAASEEGQETGSAAFPRTGLLQAMAEQDAERAARGPRSRSRSRSRERLPTKEQRDDRRSAERDA